MPMDDSSDGTTLRDGTVTPHDCLASLISTVQVLVHVMLLMTVVHGISVHCADDDCACWTLMLEETS